MYIFTGSQWKMYFLLWFVVRMFESLCLMGLRHRSWDLFSPLIVYDSHMENKKEASWMFVMMCFWYWITLCVVVNLVYRWENRVMQLICFTVEIQTDAYLILEYMLHPLYHVVFPVGREAMYNFQCVSEDKKCPNWWQLTRFLATRHWLKY